MSTITITPGQQLPAYDGERTPPPASFEFVKHYSREVFALQGSTSISYNSREPNKARLNFETLDHARMADNLLKDTVLGVDLVFGVRKGPTLEPGTPVAAWANKPVNAARAIASLPGVTSYKRSGPRNFIFATTEPETRRHLQDLVGRVVGENQFGRAVAYWKGECFGPGCKEEPKHTTGHPPLKV